MNTGELLAKLAGNDDTKQMRARQWTNLVCSCRMDLTEAQGKVLLNEPCVPEEAGTVFTLCWAINLREPVFLKTAIDILWDTSAHVGMMLNKVLDVLNEDAQRQLLKTPENFMSLLSLVNEAECYRDNVPEWQLWCPDTPTYSINNVYRAAWYVVDSRCYYEPVITEEYSLKKLKAALKTPERIDRYAQIKYKEYDYSVGYLLKAKELIESLNIPEFKPIWFRTSEDIAAEGVIMNNCIAGYWNQHGVSRVVFACIYKGRRLDIEIGETDNAFTVYQCFEKNNQTTEIADELIVKLDQAIANYYITTLPIQDHALKVCVFHDDAVLLLETGEIVIDDAKWHPTSVHQIHGIHPITGTAIAYKAVYMQYENAKFTVVIKDITGTDEVCPWPEDKHDTDDDILDDDFDDVEFEPQFEDDLFDDFD